MINVLPTAEPRMKMTTAGTSWRRWWVGFIFKLSRLIQMNVKPQQKQHLKQWCFEKQARRSKHLLKIKQIPCDFLHIQSRAVINVTLTVKSLEEKQERRTIVRLSSETSAQTEVGLSLHFWGTMHIVIHAYPTKIFVCNTQVYLGL